MLQLLRSIVISIIFLCPAAAGADDLEDMSRKIAELARLGKYIDAYTLAKSSGEIALAKHGELSTDYARAISWQAFLLQVRGQYESAEPLFKKALDIYKMKLPPGHPDIATAINNLGFNQQNSDHLEEAEKNYKLALEMREKVVPRSDAMIAESLNNLAQCYKRQNRFKDAIPLLKRSLEMRSKILDPNDPLMAQSLVNLGSAWELDGKLTEAEANYREALRIRRASQPADHPDIAGSLNKLAEVLYKQGKFIEAQALFRQVLEIRYRSQPAGHPDIATALLASALNLTELNKFEEAKSQLRNALAIQEMVLPSLHPETAQTQAALAHIADMEGDEAQALAMIKKAAVSQSARAQQNDDISRQHFASFVGIAWKYYQHHQDPVDLTLLNQALEMAQRSALTETAMTVTRMAARFASQDERLRAKARDVEELRLEATRLDQELNVTLASGDGNATTSADFVRRQIDTVALRIAKLDGELKVEFPKYAELISPDPLSIEETRALLSPDEALLYYFCGIDGVYLWVVTNERSLWQRLEPDGQRLASNISAIRTSLDTNTILTQGRSPDLFDLGRAHQMYRWLLEPARTLIADKKQLIIVPTGPLTSLPFQLLVQSPPPIPRPSLLQLTSYREADWVIKHHALSVLPAIASLRALRQTAKQLPAPYPMIGFGNPDFALKLAPPKPVPPAASVGVVAKSEATVGATPAAIPLAQPLTFTNFWRGPVVDLAALRSGLTPLPETETELKYVADRLHAPPTDLYLGANATEAAVKRTDLSQYRVVYFATHGLVAGPSSGVGEPALAFTLPDAPSELDDGLLTASEASRLKLNADWVILSACDTAGGGQSGAEALSGLAKSFFQAGARALLVSHWRVGSIATTRLMSSTFEMLEHDPSIGRAEALRRAMLTFVADRTDPWNAYPTFWAPFVVIGEGRL